MVDGSHAESFPQVVGDEGGISSAFGQLSFVDGQQNQVAEIQVSGFQNAHYLHTDGRFAVEGNIGSTHHPFEQALEGTGLYRQVFGLYQGVETVHQGIGLEQRFAVELVERVV